MNNEFLYPCFNNWIGSIWFIADTHFGDVELKKVRNISDDELVNRINRKVSKNDTLVLLGDVGDLTYIKKLKAGYKVLILGNHDKGATTYKRIRDRAPNDFVEYYLSDNKLFDEVYEGGLMINEKIMLSHEPFETSYTFNIHGHDHSGRDFKKYVLKHNDADMSIDNMSENYLSAIKKHNLKKLNVCADWVGYSPVSLKNIMKSGVLKNSVDIHQITIDKATEKVKERK